jgi:SAM-dependent methyltransferase
MSPHSQEKIWAHFQNRDRHAFDGAGQRLDYLIKRIQSLPRERHLKVLNVGTGNGYLEEQVMAQGWDSYSLDPDRSAVERLIAKGICGEVGRIEQMPFPDDLFDIVVVSEVLEHISGDLLPKALQETYRVLKHGGHLIGTVPYREKLEDWHVVCPACGQIFHRWGHQLSFDEGSMSRQMSGLFAIESLEPKYLPPWSGLNWKGRLTASVKLGLVALGFHGRGQNLFFLAKKA